ncbi:MAG: hypothetical protein AAF743_14840 [Planctomycetota bacterium]
MRSLLCVLVMWLTVPALAHPYEPVFEALEAAVTEADEALMADPDAADPAALADLEARLEPVLAQWHEVASVETVDWGVDWEQGIATELDYLNGMRPLIGVSWAVAPFRSGDELVADIVATAHTARHLNQRPIVVSLLVGYGLEIGSRREAGRELARLSERELEMLSTALSEMAPLPSMADAIRGESDLFLVSLDQHDDPVKLSELLEMYTGEKPDAARLGVWADPAYRERVSGQVKSLYDEAARIAELDADQRASATRRWQVLFDESEPVTQVFVPQLGRATRTSDRFAVDQMLLGLALDGLIAGDVEGHVGDAADYEALPDGGFKLSKVVDAEYTAELVVDGVE